MLKPLAVTVGMLDCRKVVLAVQFSVLKPLTLATINCIQMNIRVIDCGGKHAKRVLPGALDRRQVAVAMVLSVHVP